MRRPPGGNRPGRGTWEALPAPHFRLSRARKRCYIKGGKLNSIDRTGTCRLTDSRSWAALVGRERMNREPPGSGPAADPVLQAYLLGAVDFEAALLLQRRLVYEVSGDRCRAA